MKYPIRFYLSGWSLQILIMASLSAAILLHGFLIGHSHALDLGAGFGIAGAFAWWCIRYAPYLRHHLALDRLDWSMDNVPVCKTLDECNTYLALEKELQDTINDLPEEFRQKLADPQ